MQTRDRRLLLFGTATLLRLILFFGFPLLPEFLTGRVEISTPVTSFKRLQEGLFLYTHNVSPYDGGVFYQAPLLLTLFSFLPSRLFSVGSSLLFVLTDLACGNALIEIAEHGISGNERLFQSPRRNTRWDSLAVGAAYLFNPLTVAACLGRPTVILTNFAILLAVSKAVQGKSTNAVLALALASYLSLYPVLLLPALLLLSYDVQYGQTEWTANIFLARQIPSFLGFLGALLVSSYLVTGASWEFLSSTYGNQLLLVDLTPNIGLWWYFFIEMFDSFREFFLGVFWLHLVSYTAGLCIKLRRQPLFIVTTMLGLFAVFKPYPAVSDASLYLAFLPLYRHVFPLMRYTFLFGATLLYAILLGPAFYYLWIYAGSGNANFFYAITLVWSLGLSFLIADSIWAVLRDEWEVERPDMRDKFIRQI